VFHGRSARRHCHVPSWVSHGQVSLVLPWKMGGLDCQRWKYLILGNLLSVRRGLVWDFEFRPSSRIQKHHSGDL
jgi:hypothetical protein